MTNNHVIADADEITVILHDDTNLKAELVGRDTKTDIALLKVKTDKPLAAVTWGDSDAARVGDWVLAIGNPFGLGGSVTAGILSARQRDINSGPYDDFLQTDASINRGNSGGPMFNMDGQVIGINTAIYSPSGGSIGIGFAIPSIYSQGRRRRAGERDRSHRASRLARGAHPGGHRRDCREPRARQGARRADRQRQRKRARSGRRHSGRRRGPELRRPPGERHATSAASGSRDPGRQDRAGDGLAQTRGNHASSQDRQARGERSAAGERPGAARREAAKIKAASSRRSA